MSNVYKLTQKSVCTDDVGRHTIWYLLDERKMGYYISHVEWWAKRDQGFLKLDSECMAFRYNGKKGCVTNWGELEVVYDMKPQQAFETICKRLGIRVTYILG